MAAASHAPFLLGVYFVQLASAPQSMWCYGMASGARLSKSVFLFLLSLVSMVSVEAICEPSVCTSCVVYSLIACVHAGASCIAWISPAVLTQVSLLGAYPQHVLSSFVLSSSAAGIIPVPEGFATDCYAIAFFVRQRPPDICNCQTVFGLTIVLDIVLLQWRGHDNMACYKTLCKKCTVPGA